MIRGDDALVSFDEHTIPRWTHKFSIRKGYVTTRNKYMRCEKLFYGYDVELDRYLACRATPGDVRAARPGGAADPAGAAARPAAAPARPVRRRGGQVGRRRAGLVGPGGRRRRNLT